MASSLDHQAFGQTRAEWLANLNTEFKPPREFRRTSIICTIGTSTSIKLTIEKRNMLICPPFRPQDQQPREDEHAPHCRHEHCPHELLPR